jgi:hypothetical protein
MTQAVCSLDRIEHSRYRTSAAVRVLGAEDVRTSLWDEEMKFKPRFCVMEHGVRIGSHKLDRNYGR